IQNESGYGTWLTAVREDSAGRSKLNDARAFLAAERMSGFAVAKPRLPSDAWLAKNNDRSRLNVAGVDSFAVGWPIRCMRATAAWRSTRESGDSAALYVVEGVDFDHAWNFELPRSSLASAGTTNVIDVLPTQFLWKGYLINVGLWSLSLMSLPIGLAIFRELRSRVRSSRSLCHQCGYPLLSGRCPECGSTVAAGTKN
ncbi:MAG: hypothetical protein K2X32_09745, partial [Phycisphaerales bacterium]|nr:hypothetical protein [Phycisphaerales bacterium]